MELMECLNLVLGKETRHEVNSLRTFVPHATCCVFFTGSYKCGLKVRLYAERTLCRSCSVLEVIHTHEHTHTAAAKSRCLTNTQE